MSTDIGELFVAIIEWAGQKHGGSLNAVPGCWEGTAVVDGHPAKVVINAHDEGNPSSDGFDVPPFHVAITINGWPSVLLGPHGGVMVGYDGEMENRLIEAFRSSPAACDEAVARVLA